MLRYSVLHGTAFQLPFLGRAAGRFLELTYDREPELATVAFERFNAGAADLRRNDAPELFRRASELGYLRWPRRVREWIAGRDVLDIGCGTGAHGIGFVVSGAKSYTGVDPRIDVARDRVKDLRSGGWTGFGWTGEEIMGQLPRIRLVSGRVDELAADDSFDVAVMHNVTEHLIDLDGVLSAVAKHLRPSGQLIYNHHNFFAWNGHHLKPKSIADIDTNDPEQRKYLDWAHLAFEAPPGHYFLRGLNRLRLHEVREITERYFDILEWTLVPTPESKGAGRLTPEIRKRHPELSKLELETQHAFCRATPKKRPPVISR